MPSPHSSKVGIASPDQLLNAMHPALSFFFLLFLQDVRGNEWSGAN
jgi:hypothetical protein